MTIADLPRGWIIFFLLIALVAMRFFGIDSWTTAALSMLIGYLTGQHIEATTDTQYVDTAASNPLDEIIPPN